MRRYWVITPYNSIYEDAFERAWRYDLAHNVVAIGWPQMGDVSQLENAELEQKIRETYKDKKDKSVAHVLRTFKNFYRDIKEGDVIIARKGRKIIIGVGEVTSRAFYDEKMALERNSKEDPQYIYPNFIGVRWDEKIITFDRLVHGMQTIYEISEERFELLLRGKEDEVEENVEDQKEFILEKYLEDFIVSNFSKIFGDTLVIYQEEEGNGQQYPTDVGTIDILAREVDTNDYVVIELKKGRESDKVVGQILRYMGWVKENLASGKELVKGLIICREKNTKMEYALKAIPQANIDLKLYKVDFKLV